MANPFTDGAGAAMDEHYRKERLRVDKAHKAAAKTRNLQSKEQVMDEHICGKPAVALKCVDEFWFFGRCSEHRTKKDKAWIPGPWDTPRASVCRYPEPDTPK